MSWLRRMLFWRTERQRRMDVAHEQLQRTEERLKEAERATRVAREQWPAVRRAQHGFAADMRSAMRRRYSP